MQVRELVPQYKVILELYQSEAFKPLAKFLAESYDGTVAEILSLSRDRNYDEKKSIALVSQLGVVGVIKDLPVILNELKTQFEANEKRQEQMKKSAEDPLAKEI